MGRWGKRAGGQRVPCTPKGERRVPPEHERSIVWNDETLAIEWPVSTPDDVLLSSKDANATSFSAAETFN